MNTSNYIFQLFDSHNTCTEQEIPLARTASMARVMAMKLSTQYEKVIVNKGESWEQYEKGSKTEWSFPVGLI